MRFKSIVPVLVFTLTLMICAGALALDAVDMPISAFNLFAPSGLALQEGTVLKSPGRIDLAIDDEKTSWLAAVAGGHGEYAQLVYRFVVPDDIGVGDAVNLIFEDPEEDIDDLIADIESHPSSYRVIGTIENQTAFAENGMPIAENAITFGEYLPDSGYLNPHSADYTLYVAWYKADGKGGFTRAYPYQRLHVSATHTQEQAFPVPGTRPAPQANIQTDSRYTAQVSDGKVVYTMPAVSGESEKAQTIITLPDGATNYVIPSLMGATTGNGSLYLYGGPDTYRPVYVSEQTIVFFDDEGQVVDAWALAIVYQTEQNLAWPNYVDGYNKLTIGSGNPATDRLIIRNGAQEAGYQITYHNDTALMESSFTGEVGNNAALTGEVEVTVKAPEGAKSFRYTDFGGNNGILGQLWQDASDYDAELRFMWDGDVNRVGVHPLPSYKYNALRKIQPADVENLALYLPSVPADPCYANFMVINWYSDTKGKDLLCRDFMWETIKPGKSTKLYDLYESEAALENKPVKIPCVIGPSLQQAWRGNWQLLVTTYYQEGINARHYEFHLVDKNGTPVILPAGETVTVYLPFPQEMAGAMPYDMAFDLRHYSAKLYDTKDPDLDGVPMEIEVTEYGLRLQTDRFSPFVVSWEEKPASPLVLPDSLTAIRTDAFRGADFTSVYVPDGCTSIGSGAFADCLRLQEASLPEALTEIAEDAFPNWVRIVVRD